jgi:molybdopterin synthase catalytic subunit
MHIVKGEITPEFMVSELAKLDENKTIGAHSTFLGQVRADTIKDQTVSHIEYSAYEPMAEKRFKEIETKMINEFELKELKMFHSVGNVRTGKISLFVIVSAKHRKDTFDALEKVVNLCKYHVPIWKKEVFENGSHRWVDECEHHHHEHNHAKATL